jgi:hypothetical protein
MHGEHTQGLVAVEVPSVDDVHEACTEDSRDNDPHGSRVDVVRINASVGREPCRHNRAGVDPGHDHEAVPPQGEGPDMGDHRVNVDLDQRKHWRILARHVRHGRSCSVASQAICDTVWQRRRRRDDDPGRNG